MVVYFRWAGARGELGDGSIGTDTGEARGRGQVIWTFLWFSEFGIIEYSEGREGGKREGWNDPAARRAAARLPAGQFLNTCGALRLYLATPTVGPAPAPPPPAPPPPAPSPQGMRSFGQRWGRRTPPIRARVFSRELRHSGGVLRLSILTWLSLLLPLCYSCRLCSYLANNSCLRWRRVPYS